MDMCVTRIHIENFQRYTTKNITKTKILYILLHQLIIFMAILYFIDFHFFLFSTSSSRTKVSLKLNNLPLRLGLAGSDRTGNGFEVEYQLSQTEPEQVSQR